MQPYIQNILRSLEIEKLLPMQEEFSKEIKKQDKIMLLAPTGSGKTIAYLLPVIESIENTKTPPVKCLIISPSRELGLQVETVLKKLGLSHTTASLIGGRPVKDEKNKLLQAPQIIIATPGRLLDHVGKQSVDISTLDYLILDEYDKTLEMGFEEELKTIFSRVKKCQKTILVSATTSVRIPDFTQMKDAFVMKSEDFQQKNTNTSYIQLKCEEKDRSHYLYHTLFSVQQEKTIVFFNHREAVERLEGFLKDRQFPCAALHGGMDQEDRELALMRFLNDSVPVLLSTDLVGRGIDIPELENVIHYQNPPKEDQWTHRNGRTARMGAAGKVYFFEAPKFGLQHIQSEITVLSDLQEPVEAPTSNWQTLVIKAGKKQKISKGDIAGFILKNTSLGKDQLGKILVGEYYSYAAVSKLLENSDIEQLAKEKLKGIKAKISLV